MQQAARPQQPGVYMLMKAELIILLNGYKKWNIAASQQLINSARLIFRTWVPLKGRIHFFGIFFMFPIFRGISVRCCIVITSKTLKALFYFLL